MKQQHLIIGYVLVLLMVLFGCAGLTGYLVFSFVQHNETNQSEDVAAAPDNESLLRRAPFIPPSPESESDTDLSLHSEQPQSTLDPSTLDLAFVNHFSSLEPISKESDQKEIQQLNDYMYHIKLLLHDFKFKELNEEYKKIQTTDKQFEFGPWKIFYFFEALGQEGERYNKLTKGQYNYSYEWGLDLWEKQFPDSIVPHVARARFLIDEGWKIRTNKDAKKVSEEQWRQFHKKLTAAWDILEKAEKKYGPDAELYHSMLIVGKGLGKDKTELHQIFEKGLEANPKFYMLYFDMAEILHRKWMGSDQERDDFFNWTYSHTKSEEGAQMYTSLNISAINCNYDKLDTYFAQHPSLSWAVIKEGALEKYKKIQISKSTMNRLAWLACAAEDKEATKVLLRLIKDYSKDGVWKKGNNIQQCIDLASR